MEQLCKNQKVNTKKTNHITLICGKSQNVKTTEHISSTRTSYTSRSGNIVKLLTKTQGVKNIAN